VKVHQVVGKAACRHKLPSQGVDTSVVCLRQASQHTCDSAGCSDDLKVISESQSDVMEEGLAQMTVALLIAGLMALVVGAELLVRGSSTLASIVGLSPLIIGLTVVAFGTSAPELTVSISSALNGQADLALGNVVGSNIFNVLLILGLSALIIPLVVDQKLIRFDVPLMVVVSILVLLMGLDYRISRSEGGVLFAGLIAYTGWCIHAGRREMW
jgi:Ca2+/Na+ antiporter